MLRQIVPVAAWRWRRPSRVRPWTCRRTRRASRGSSSLSGRQGRRKSGRGREWSISWLSTSWLTPAASMHEWRWWASFVQKEKKKMVCFHVLMTNTVNKIIVSIAVEQQLLIYWQSVCIQGIDNKCTMQCAFGFLVLHLRLKFTDPSLATGNSAYVVLT
jgi:hypothetical protein